MAAEGRTIGRQPACPFNHVILNLKYGARNAGDVLEEIGKEILPQLAASQP